jgi:uncharacterized membrane protein
MFSIPDPLHPAVVHFPIVLLLVGAVVAVVGIFVNRRQFAWLAAVLLGLGAVSGFLAVRSGDLAEEGAGELSPSVEALVEAHEEWAERAQIAGAIAAALAILAATLSTLVWRRGKKTPAETGPARPATGMVTLPTLGLSVRVFAAIVAITACFFVYQTARRGGELVYAHGVGVKSGTAQIPANPRANDD